MSTGVLHANIMDLKVMGSKVCRVVSRISETRHPAVALRIEVMRELDIEGEALDAVLDDLSERGLIEMGPTVNDVWIKKSKK